MILSLRGKCRFNSTNVCALTMMMFHCLWCYCFHGVVDLVIDAANEIATVAVDFVVAIVIVIAGLVNNFAMKQCDGTPMTCKSWMIDRLSSLPLSNRLDMEPVMAPLMIKLWSTGATLYVTLMQPPAMKTYFPKGACRVLAFRLVFYRLNAQRIIARLPSEWVERKKRKREKFGKFG